MAITMPELEEGRIYHEQEVAGYIGLQDGTSDFDVMKSHFPRSLDRAFQHNPYGWRDGEEILLQYRVFIVEGALKRQIKSLLATYWADEAGQKRVETIAEVLEQGKTVYPVFMQQDDPQQRIIEGTHRAAALYTLDCDCLPAFLAGYRDWFGEGEFEAGFHVEDEIVSASRKDVLAFHRRAICLDQKGQILSLLSAEALGGCDDFLVARHRAQIVSAVTMKVNHEKPALHTVYTLQRYRRKGVAFRLVVKALLRFQAAGVREVFCEVHSKGMAAILKRLERERPELHALIEARFDPDFKHGLEMGDPMAES